MADTMFGVGYQFVPTDRELVTNYLMSKIKDQPLPYNDIVECDLYDKSPWEIFNEKKKHYVFTKLKKASKNRVSRTAGDGTWHGNDSGKQICDGKKKNVIGVKKTFTFKVKPKLKKAFNKNPSKTEGNWVMHEFSLAGDSLMVENCSNYVLCRVEKQIKKSGKQKEEEEEQEEDHGVANNVADIKNLNTGAETSVNESEAPRPSIMPSYDDFVLSPNQYYGGLYTTEEEEAQEEDHGVANNVADVKNLNTAAETSVNERPSAMASYDVSPNQYYEGLYTTDMRESVLLDLTQSSSSTDIGEYEMGNSEYLLDFDYLDPVTEEQMSSLYKFLMDDELPTLQEDKVSMQEFAGFVDCLMDNPHQPVQENDEFLLTPMCS